MPTDDILADDYSGWDGAPAPSETCGSERFGRWFPRYATSSAAHALSAPSTRIGARSYDEGVYRDALTRTRTAERRARTRWRGSIGCGAIRCARDRRLVLDLNVTRPSVRSGHMTSVRTSALT